MLIENIEYVTGEDGHTTPVIPRVYRRLGRHPFSRASARKLSMLAADM